MDIDVESLERATLDAVAPQHTVALPGWLVPIDPSTIGRATSAVPLAHTGTHTLHAQAMQVADIEVCYAERQLPPRFRVADIAGLAGLHFALDRAGYAAQQPTLTLVGQTTAVLDHALANRAANMPQVVVSAAPNDAWQAVYLAAGFDPTDGAHRIAALSRSTTVVYASISGPDGPLAAGTASFSRGWASVHGMRTVPRARGQGLARHIIGSLARLACSQGLERVFLQVEESNAAALSLYRRLGFDVAWRYHYWRKPGA
jgi:ribosomal protein S18 acetylase RimI-like enzyme